MIIPYNTIMKICDTITVLIDDSAAADKLRMGGKIISSVATITGILAQTPTYFPGYITVQRGVKYFSYIPKKNIIKIISGTGVEQPTINKITTHEVVSARTGEKYTVTTDGNKYSCTCVGFNYHGKCKHITQIQKEQKK